MSLRERLAAPEILVAVGAHDPFSALIAERSGVESIFLGGYSVAAHMHGLPDIGFLGLSDVAEVMERISAVSTIPVIVDADTGYGSEPGVRRTVARLERAGAAGIQFEDQVTPKRCGFMSGKQLISKEDMVSKVRAAVEARSDERMILIARTDALGVSGMDDAIERATAYADAGADFVVVDAVRTRAEIEDLAARLDVPKVVPVPPTRDKPVPTVADLQELGYRIAVFPSTQGSWIMAKAYAALCEQIVESGTTANLLDEFLDLDELFAITGREGWERSVTGEHFEPPGRTSVAIRSGAGH